MPDRPKFLADEMLGSLARWLRIIGYDTEYVKDKDDTEVLELARQEDRVLLTRDKQLAERAGDKGLEIVSVDIEEQLDQVAKAFDLRFNGPMTRCTLCNGELVLVGPDEIGDRVPERVRASQREFFVCKRCGQIYWKGSHWDRIYERLSKTIGPKGDNSPR